MPETIGMSKRWKCLAALSLLYTPLVVARACALTYPLTYHAEQNIDEHQAGWIDISIDENGNGALKDSWSNGKQVAGNTFYAIVAFRATDGSVIWSDKEEKGLDPSWWGHAREGNVTKNFSLNKEQMASLDHFDLKMGAMNCGLELSSVKFTDDGIDLGFTTRPCGVPSTPKASPNYNKPVRK
jgi:hypothetical protein